MSDLQLNIIKKYFLIQAVLKIFLLLPFLLFYACKNDKKENSKEKVVVKDEIVLSQKHQENLIWCDLDGDGADEKVEIVTNQNNKSGLRITFSNTHKIDYLGLGKEVLKQGFDDFDWVGIFEKAPKGKTYRNNVNEDGEIKIEESEYIEADKLVLKNDGIYMHVTESCGGGIIYLENGTYKWLQQE